MCCFADARSVRVFILDWRCFGISKDVHQLNEDIRDSEIRLIGSTGEQLGIMSAAEALRTAEEQGLDLVKISPQATPPVCKLMNYGKYKFEQSKREKEARKNQHVVEIKEIRLSLNIDTNDFNTKLKNAQKFLSDGNRVKVSVRFRGREMAHTEIGRDLLNKFAELCTEVSTLDKAAKALDALHVEEIEALGKPFDPNFMNAVQQVPAEDGQESGTVVRVFQKGYMIGDKIIRHATVVVAE